MFNTPRNICCGYLLELPRRGNSNKYPQHMFHGENKEKELFVIYHLVHVAILYRGKFFLTEESWGDRCCCYNEGSLYMCSINNKTKSVQGL